MKTHRMAGYVGKAKLIETPTRESEWFTRSGTLALFSAGALLEGEHEEGRAVQCLMTVEASGRAECPHVEGDVVTVAYRADTAFVLGGAPLD